MLTLAVATGRWGQGIGSALLERAAGRGGQARLHRGLPRGARPTTTGRRQLYRRHEFTRDRDQAGLLPALGSRRPGDAPQPGRAPRTAGRRRHDGAAGAGNRDRRATRPASAWSAVTNCSPTRSPPAWTSTRRFGGVVPEVASRAHLEAMVPAVQRALDTRRGHARPGGRDRGHRRARGWPGRCSSACAPRRPTRSRSASRCTGSITSRRISRSTSLSTARCRPRRSPCWSRAGIRRCCWCAT